MCSHLVPHNNEEEGGRGKEAAGSVWKRELGAGSILKLKMQGAGSVGEGNQCAPNRFRITMKRKAAV